MFGLTYLAKINTEIKESVIQYLRKKLCIH